MVRAKAEDAPTPPPAADNTDLDGFFGGDVPQSQSSGRKDNEIDSFFGGDNSSDADKTIDDFFGGDGGGDADLFGGGSGGDDLFAENDEDLFGAADSDGGDKDLFGDNGGEDSDLFGDGGDLFGDDNAPADPQPTVTQGTDDEEPGASDEDALNSLFEDSTSAQSDAGGPAAMDASSDPAPGDGATPDFDWDDDNDDGAAADAPGPPAEIDFTPGIDEFEAEKVLRDTLVQDSLPEKRGVSIVLIILVVLTLAAGGAGTYFFMNPDVFHGMTGIHLETIIGGDVPSAEPEKEISPLRPVSVPKNSVVQNRKGSQLLVLEGQLNNTDTEPHSFARIKATLVNETGQDVTDVTVYAGNILSQLQMKNFPPEELNNLLQVEMGSQLRNFNIAPGGYVPYMIIFSPMPEGGESMTARIEVIGSFRGER